MPLDPHERWWTPCAVAAVAAVSPALALVLFAFRSLTHSY